LSSMTTGRKILKSCICGIDSGASNSCAAEGTADIQVVLNEDTTEVGNSSRSDCVKSCLACNRKCTVNQQRTSHGPTAKS